ncbi:uncharacterized protein [Choristoneura fumiferana]|uniref:uncharacterized protein n=1 Tax=Choristoneura fumiferana TaxID=7141 RepID=UPI003D15AB11
MVYHKLLSAAWLLLAAAVAVELYDEVPPADVDNDTLYQDMNAVPSVQHEEGERGGRLQDLLMIYRLIKSQLREEIQATERRASHDFREMDFLDANSLAKRIPPANRPRPQQRWKTKKGRGMGPQMVCYFKLCAFRNPA